MRTVGAAPHRTSFRAEADLLARAGESHARSRPQRETSGKRSGENSAMPFATVPTIHDYRADRGTAFLFFASVTRLLHGIGATWAQLPGALDDLLDAAGVIGGDVYGEAFAG